VTVKGSACVWSEQPMTNNGTGVHTFVLSNVIGAGKPLFLSGLTKSGEEPEFIFAFDGKESKPADGTAGVTAATKASGSVTSVPATIAINASNKNPCITVPQHAGPNGARSSRPGA
jgi:hypothetical protein